MDFLSILKKSKRGGDVECSVCGIVVYCTPNQIQRMDVCVCKDCTPPKPKKKKRERKRRYSVEETEAFKLLRLSLIEKSGQRCSECGHTENLHIHHIDGDYSNNDESNLSVLCKYCHAKKHPKLANLILSSNPRRPYKLR